MSNYSSPATGAGGVGLSGNLAPRFSARMLAIATGFSVVALWADRKLLHGTPASFSPEFQAAAERIGPVAERTSAPPVFLNPIRRRIPGHLRGPDDVADV
ncbi:hypothetical protein Rsub_08413 [Raphidocelis subcapitata]|uniref:Uncharacterized protein n=1 Tax=Raphidocelis subcapitata TaxID=307507 RepID=A0A2V0P6F9_9CHLO|nr:hypothetical protein Rsub_08413 [Raphidocelis subcapitata]|eukprot:GBF95451.1 hypothetical protein Rsub_08413 [Raphidocelis subcapitata]